MADLAKLDQVAKALETLANPKDHREFNKLVTMTGKWERPVLNELCEMLGVQGRYDGTDAYSTREIALTREIEKKLGLKDTGVIGPTLKHAIIDYIDRERGKLREAGIQTKLDNEVAAAPGTAHRKTRDERDNEIAATPGTAHRKTRDERDNEIAAAPGTAHRVTKDKFEAEERGDKGTKHGDTKETLVTTEGKLKDEQYAALNTNHGNSRTTLLGAAEEKRLRDNLRTSTKWYGPMANQGWDRFDHMVENTSSYKPKDVANMEDALVEQVAHIRARSKAIEEVARTKKDVSNGQFEKWADAEKAVILGELKAGKGTPERFRELELKAMADMDKVVQVYGKRHGLKEDTVTVRNAEGVETKKQVYTLDDASAADMNVAYKIGARTDHDSTFMRGVYRIFGQGAAERAERTAGGRGAGAPARNPDAITTAEATVKIGDKDVVLTGVADNTKRVSAGLARLQSMPGIVVSHENDKLTVKRGDTTLATYDYKQKETVKADASANADSLKKIEADARAGLFNPPPAKHETAKATVKLNGKDVEVNGLEANNKKLGELAAGLKPGLSLDHVNGKLIVARGNQKLASYDYVLTETQAPHGVRNGQALSSLEADLKSTKFDAKAPKANKNAVTTTERKLALGAGPETTSFNLTVENGTKLEGLIAAVKEKSGVTVSFANDTLTVKRGEQVLGTYGVHATEANKNEAEADAKSLRNLARDLKDKKFDLPKALQTSGAGPDADANVIPGLDMKIGDLPGHAQLVASLKELKEAGGSYTGAGKALKLTAPSGRIMMLGLDDAMLHSSAAEQAKNYSDAQAAAVRNLIPRKN